jgi:ribosome modulation factor
MLRRFREHVARQNWFAVGVDLAIVVVGVFLGTQANNWNQDRIERAEAREYRAQIIDNLRANEADIAMRAYYYRQVQAHAIAALNALKQPNAALGEPFLIDAYQASQAWLRPFERTAYDELQTSGVARKIGDARARAELSGYYVGARGFEARTAEVTPYRELLRRSMDLEVQEKIRSNCDDILRSLPGGGNAAVLPDTCHPQLDLPAIAGAVATLRALPEIREDLTRLIVDIDQKMILYERTSRNAVRLRKELEAS